MTVTDHVVMSQMLQYISSFGSHKIDVINGNGLGEHSKSITRLIAEVPCDPGVELAWEGRLPAQASC